MCIEDCVDNLRKDYCVAFIGAGVSRSYYDDNNNKEYPGLPTSQEFVQLLSKKTPDLIKPDMPFEKACFLFRKKYKKKRLSEFLLDAYDKKINPLPAHLLLAELPFSAYISMNYDKLLEVALKGSDKNFLRITSDKDVTKLSSSDIPLIYPHGCIVDPDSCLTAQDEMSPFFKNKQIIKSLIKVLLASKSIIFFGFSLSDNDFHELYSELTEILGHNMLLNYAICRNCDSYSTEYWPERGVKIINQDLTDFLKSLFHEYYGRDYKESKNAWILNEFFISLHGIHNIPSESQVIDAFINHLQEELTYNDVQINSLAERAKNAKKLLMKHRPNFEAFKKCSEKALGALNENGDLLKIQNDILDLKDQRETITTKIKYKSRKMTRLCDLLDGGSVLLYSQSNRVIEFLSSMPPALQQNCILYIAECRPKSPSSFQDALSFSEKLTETTYNKIIIPDVLIGSLFDNKEISCAILGAHTVIVDNNKHPIEFVNTAGSLTIGHLCLIYKKTLVLVAESDKETETNPKFFEEEASLTSRLDPKVRARISKENRLNVKNIGYDVVPCEKLIKNNLLVYINEK